MIGKVFNCYFSQDCDYINKNMLIYGKSDYRCEKCKVKILKFSVKPYVWNTFFIQDNDEDVIQTKFNDYYYVMYNSKKIPRYSDLWKERKVYL